MTSGSSYQTRFVYSQDHWCEVQDGAAGVNILVGELLRTGKHAGALLIRWFDHEFLLPPALPPEGRVNVYCHPSQGYPMVRYWSNAARAAAVPGAGGGDYSHLMASYQPQGYGYHWR